MKAARVTIRQALAGGAIPPAYSPAMLIFPWRIIDALDTFKPNLGRNLFIERAIKEAATILETIDEQLLFDPGDSPLEFRMHQP